MLSRDRNIVRRTVGKVAHHLARGSGYSRRRARALKQPRILMYHAVTDGKLSPKLLDAQLAFLRRHLEIVSLGDLCTRHARRELRGNEVVLTFDDGVRNHLSVVYPILSRHRAPATYFVCSGRATSGQWLWNWEMEARLESLDTGARERVARELGAPGADVAGLLRWAMRLGLAARQQAEQTVRRATPTFEPSDEQLDSYSPLSWAELRTLDPALITIGSHTIDHPILPTLEVEQARHEIEGSRRQLEEQLDREVDLFCYPNGDLSPATAELVKQNYRAAVTTVAGFAGADALAHLLPRIGAPESMATFVWRLHRK